MDDRQLAELILQNATRDGDRLKLACERAHQLAAELGVDVCRIGEVCRAERIKITRCQLGCFGDGKG